jgi:hypothetical protein
MKCFPVLALVGALCLAGGTSLASGPKANPQTPAKPQVTKTSLPAQPTKPPQGKSASPTPTPASTSTPTAKQPPAQSGKSANHNSVKIDVPKSNPKPGAKNQPKSSGQQPSANKGVDWGKVGRGAAELALAAGDLAAATVGGAEAVATAPTFVGALPGIALAGVATVEFAKNFLEGGKDIIDGFGGKTLPLPWQ